MHLLCMIDRWIDILMSCECIRPGFGLCDKIQYRYDIGEGAFLFVYHFWNECQSFFFNFGHGIVYRA